MGDMDIVYVEVLFIGDDFLFVKLMDRLGFVFDYLFNEVVVEVFNVIMLFVVE